MKKNQIMMPRLYFILLFIIVMLTIFITNFSQIWSIAFMILTIFGFSVAYFKNHRESVLREAQKVKDIEESENNFSLTAGKLLLVIMREFLVENENKLMNSEDFVKAKNINNAYDIITSVLNNSLKHKVNNNKKLFISNEQMSKIIKKNKSLLSEYSNYIDLSDK